MTERREGLDGIQLHYVDSIEKSGEFLRWLGERRPLGAVGVDIETGERPGGKREDALSPWHGQIRLVQVGDGMQGWSIPWDEWAGVFYQGMVPYEGQIVCHNIAFEAKWFGVQSRWKFPWHQAHDTMIMAHLINPLGTGALKQLAATYVDAQAVRLQSTLDEQLSANGWTWGTVPTNFGPYWSYGALDTILTIRLWEQFYEKCGPGKPYSLPYELEMATRRIVTSMEINGARVDLDYSRKKYDELIAYTESVKDWARNTYGGVSITSTVQLARLFESLGGEITEYTPTGQKSLTKDQLKRFVIEGNPEVKNLAETVLAQRKADKLASSYFQNFLEKSINGFVHPSVRTLGARTGRMCLPIGHRLVTTRGILDYSEILPGDVTIDHRGNKTEVLEVFSYGQQPVKTWRLGHVSVTSTEEHRWVTSSERGVLHIEPFHDVGRRRVHLAPLGESFDFTVKDIPAQTDEERFAALVGMLVSDGRAAWPDENEAGLRAYVYQTEDKFYKEFLNVLPADSVMYDRITTDTSSGPHHEIRINTRWLRPRLESSGLEMHRGDLLKEHPRLLDWVMGLPLNELRAFFTAVWLSDGSTAHPQNKKITAGSANLRRCLRVAGYRLGLRSRETNDGLGGWSSRDRMGVRFSGSVVYSRSPQVEESVSDVWCVRTTSGTFTAWSDELGAYLTGNSITDPALQTLPSGEATVRRAFVPRDEDHVIISSDLDQVEFRLTAALSEDPDLIALFLEADRTGGDAFTSIMRDVYQDPTAQKSDPRRKLIKGVVYGKLYGAGPAKMALTAGVPESQMKSVVDAFDTAYPGVKRLQKNIENIGMQRLRSEGEGYVLTRTGRRLPCDDDRVYSLTNYLVQSSAAEIFKQNLIKLDQSDLTDMMVVPVHDEIVLQVPREDVAEVMPLVQQCMTTTEGWAVPLTAGVDGPFDTWGDKYN